VPAVLYLDHNASAPMHPAVIAAVAQAMAELPANPHSPHAAGRAAAAAVERGRAQVAQLVGRPPRQVRFTSGATEANAWALHGLSQAARARGVDRPEVLVSAVEHPSVLAWATRVLPVDAEGRLRMDALDQALDELGGRVAALSLMAANNETGVLQPVAQAEARCRAAGVPLHCDASQLPGRLPVDLPPSCLITLSAHKLGGPKGVGALVCAEAPPALLRGGPQERGSRAGTVAVPLVVGMGEAATRCNAQDPSERDALEAACRRLGGRILGESAPRLPNTVAALFELPGDLLVMALDLEGVAASTGAACSSGAAEESHVLRAMGLRGLPVRFSLGPDSRVAPAIAALERVLARARAVGVSA